MLRAKDVEICGVGGLAISFYQRFDLGGEPLPDICNPGEWYYTKLYPGKKGLDKELDAKTHSNSVKAVRISCY